MDNHIRTKLHQIQSLLRDILTVSNITEGMNREEKDRTVVLRMAELLDAMNEAPMMESPNTKIEYLYRDASNWKRFQSVVVSGVLTEQQIREILEVADPEGRFIPEQVGLPLERFGSPTEEDHPYAELGGAEAFSCTYEVPTEMQSAEDLYQAFMKAKEIGWEDWKY